MFGIGNLVGGLLDKIGLGELAPFVSMGINFFTGNWAGLVGDVANLVSRFTDSSFLDRVAQFAPLGGFAGGNFGDFLSPQGLSNFADRLDDLGSSVRSLSEGWERINEGLDIAREVLDDRNRVDSLRYSAYMSSQVSVNWA